MSFANEIFEILRNAVNETKYRVVIQETFYENIELKEFPCKFIRSRLLRTKRIFKPPSIRNTLYDKAKITCQQTKIYKEL